MARRLATLATLATATAVAAVGAPQAEWGPKKKHIGHGCYGFYGMVLKYGCVMA